MYYVLFIITSSLVHFHATNPRQLYHISRMPYVGPDEAYTHQLTSIIFQYNTLLARLTALTDNLYTTFTNSIPNLYSTFTISIPPLHKRPCLHFPMWTLQALREASLVSSVDHFAQNQQTMKYANIYLYAMDLEICLDPTKLTTKGDAQTTGLLLKLRSHSTHFFSVRIKPFQALWQCFSPTITSKLRKWRAPKRKSKLKGKWL